MKSIEEQKNNSTCYGIAFDDKVKECKICEIKQECKMKTEGATVEKPEKPEIKKEEPSKTTKTTKTTKTKTKKASKSKQSKQSKPKEPDNPDMPDFKSMSMEELELLAEDRKADMDWKKYDNAGIRRMRLTMALKKTY